MAGSMRTYATNEFTKIMDGNEKHAKNLEIAVFNWTVRRLPKNPSWSDKVFRESYKFRFIQFKNALVRKNSILKQSIINKQVKMKDVMMMTPDQLMPDGPYALALQSNITRELEIEKNKAKLDEEYEGIFKCRKCHSKKTSYYQLQTRSADEPMTTYVTCMNCNNHWKFC